MRRLLVFASASFLVAACGGGSGVGNNNNNGNEVGECGNGIVEGAEACDASDLAGADCFTRGYLEGTLRCTATCTFDESGCSGVNPCGNGTREATEICDGDDLGGQSCEGLGFSGGTLACTNRCELDTSGCEGVNPCGNGQLDANEPCDGTRLGGGTCETEGFAGGVLACTSTCTLDTSGCVSAAGYVVINELALGNPDWVELYNPSSVTVDLAGWELHWWGLNMQGNPTDATVILPAYDLGPGEFVVLQDSQVWQPEDPSVVDVGLIDLGQNVSWDYADPGAAMLSDAGGAVDYLRWGDDTFDPGAASWADTPDFVSSDFPQGRTLGRRIDGVDTDTAGDWCVQETSDGTANAGCLVPGVLPGELLITEIDVGEGGNTRPDSVELQNVGSAPIELGGLVFAWWSSQGGTGGDVLPDYTLNPGERVVLVDDVQNWQQVSADPQNGLIHVHNINWSETTEGACAIQDSAIGSGIDFVRWGDTIDVTPVAPDQWDDAAGRLPLIPGPDGTTLGRASATDTDTSADWCLMPMSLGDANGGCL